MWQGLPKVTQQVGDVRPQFHICLIQAQVWPFLQEAGEVILKGRQGSWPYKRPKGGRSKAEPKRIRRPEGTRS